MCKCQTMSPMLLFFAFPHLINHFSTHLDLIFELVFASSLQDLPSIFTFDSSPPQVTLPPSVTCVGEGLLRYLRLGFLPCPSLSPGNHTFLPSPASFPLLFERYKPQSESWCTTEVHGLPGEKCREKKERPNFVLLLTQS